MPRVPTLAENPAHETYYVASDRGRARRAGLRDTGDVFGDNGFPDPGVSLAERVALASRDSATDAD